MLDTVDNEDIAAGLEAPANPDKPIGRIARRTIARA